MAMVEGQLRKMMSGLLYYLVRILTSVITYETKDPLNSYIFCAGGILPLHLNYICVCIDMFVHHITVYALIYLCMLYNQIVDCTSFWIFPPVYMWVIIPRYWC